MSYELMFQKALSLQQNGALTEAEQLYRQILETAPKNADVLNLLGLIAQQRGLHSEAVSYFYQAADSAPNHFPVFFNLGISLTASGHLLEAIEAYKKALQLKPDLKEAYLALGNVYWQQKNITDATNSFQNALNLDKDYLEAAINLAEVQNDEKALQDLATANPLDSRPLYYLGRRAFTQKKYELAVDYLNKANVLFESDEIKTLLAEALLILQKNDKAFPLLYQAIIINPHNVVALLNIADLEAEKQNYAEAEKFYKKTIELDSNNMQAHANYANMLCKCKRTLEALEEYRAAVRIAPETPELSFNLAVILKTLEEYEQALSLMFNAFYLAPHHIDWSLNLAETIILFYQTEPQKALKIAQNWFEKMPQNTVSKHLWAVLNGKIPDNDQAYNKLLFDFFANSYEKTLKDIHYAVADKIAELSTPFVGKILDLGCGTGLIGAKIKNKDNQIIGIDISESMLRKAEEKSVYTKLEKTDALTYLQQHYNEFSVIIAADVFCYFGDLEKVLAAAYPTKIIFSIESDLKTENYQVQANGRYKHNPLYVENLLKQSGYGQIKKHNLVLRQEGGIDVAGVIFTAEV